ncbi:hypothetical protein VNO77_20515 [Canavalia gladiata]|uniref:Uncharacterized protein n=1 Tax=Canavalia gladiata TaxID=3824 RepID=A0AAN9QLB7_CANGL
MYGYTLTWDSEVVVNDRENIEHVCLSGLPITFRVTPYRILPNGIAKLFKVHAHDAAPPCTLTFPFEVLRICMVAYPQLLNLVATCCTSGVPWDPVKSFLSHLTSRLKATSRCMDHFTRFTALAMSDLVYAYSQTGSLTVVCSPPSECMVLFESHNVQEILPSTLKLEQTVSLCPS